MWSTTSSSSSDDEASSKGPQTCNTPRIPKVKSQNQIFVGGFGKTDDEVLRRYFQHYGPIEVIQNKGGYGFVTFKDKEAAEEALKKNKDGILMGGLRVSVDVVYSIPEAMKREKRRKRDAIRKKRRRKAVAEANGQTNPDQSLF